MMYRVCADCGAMLPDSVRYEKLHVEWHDKLNTAVAIGHMPGSFHLELAPGGPPIDQPQLPVTGPDTPCPNCLRSAPIQVNGIFRCLDCGWRSEKQEITTLGPRCYIDDRRATHFAPIKRRFFCAGCAISEGLNESHIIKEAV